MRALLNSLLLALCAAASMAEGASTPVVLTYAAPAEHVEGTITFRPAMGPAAPVTVSCCASAVSVDLSAAPAWEVIPSLHGGWAPTAVVSRGARAIELQLWPTVVVRGSFKVPANAAMPRSFVFRIERTSTAASGVPPATIDCPVREDGSWSCELPASKPDVAIQAAGFVPHYFWSVDLAQEPARNFGTLTLAPGGSVSGWIALERGKPEAGRGAAYLAPPVIAGTPLSARAPLMATAPILSNGFFQLSGLRAGSYVLRLRYPGFADEETAPLRVTTATETRVRQLITLRLPIALHVDVLPPRDPEGKPWRVQISRRSGGRPVPVLDSVASSEGTVVTPAVASGRYSLRVFDSGNQPMADEEFDADAANPRHTVNVHLITVRGTLRMAGKPVEGTIWFGGEHGLEHSVMRATPDGTYQGYIAQAGEWRVKVKTATVETELLASVAEKEGTAVVDLDVPTTRIRGTVVDHDSRPVARAEVSAVGDKGAFATTSSDGEGHFEIGGMPEGQALVSAMGSESYSLTSRPVAVTLREGDDPSPIELRLERMARLHVRVLSPRGPVPGARVAVRGENPMSPISQTAVTDVDGVADPDLPDPNHVYITVSPPGYALRVFDLHVDGRAQTLNVPEVGGTVALRNAPRNSAEQRFVFFQDGRPIDVSELVSWAVAHGEPFRNDAGNFRFPDLAPGEYRACVGTHCVSGTLAPFGTLDLDLSL